MSTMQDRMARAGDRELLIREIGKILDGPSGEDVAKVFSGFVQVFAETGRLRKQVQEISAVLARAE